MPGVNAGLQVNANDPFVATLGRVVVAGRVQAAAGHLLRWPTLHVLINPNHLGNVTANLLDRVVAAAVRAGLASICVQITNTPSCVVQDPAIGVAFPVNRRDAAGFPHAGRDLAGLTIGEVAATPYGRAVCDWIEQHTDTVFNSPFTDAQSGVLHTTTSFALFLKETVRITNANIAAGRNIVQLPSGVDGLVVGLCYRAREQALAGYFAAVGTPRVEAVVGTETEAALRTAAEISETGALSGYDTQTQGVAAFAGCILARQQLQAATAGHRAAVLARFNDRREGIAQAARLAAERLAKARAEADARAQAAAAERAYQAQVDAENRAAAAAERARRAEVDAANARAEAVQARTVAAQPLSIVGYHGHNWNRQSKNGGQVLGNILTLGLANLIQDTYWRCSYCGRTEERDNQPGPGKCIEKPVWGRP
jgi:hypothetical protein